MKQFVIICVALSLCGCAEWQAGASAIDNAATTVAQNAASDAIHVDVQLLCAQPYSALVRNAQTVKGLVTAIQSLCGPIQSSSTGILAGASATVPSAP